MRLTELDPKFYIYTYPVETWNIVDPLFRWSDERKAYVNDSGLLWEAAGRPTTSVTGQREHLEFVQSLAEAQGIMFLCPKCFEENKGPEGTHHVQMAFANRGVDPAKHENQWNVGEKSTNFEDLTTTPSYLILGGCGWHGYITNGDVSII